VSPVAAAVQLVPLQEGHLDSVAAAAGEEQVARFTRFPVPIPDGWVRSWFDGYLAGRAAGTREAFAAIDPGDGRFLGLALAPHIDAEGQELELGYLVTPAERGRGVAAAVLVQLTEWAFGDRAAVRLSLMIDADNLASQAVARHAGYRLEGTLRSAYFKQGLRADCQLWSRLNTD
jgi:RimJ/RimL family protein N-acetyltransferase